MGLRGHAALGDEEGLLTTRLWHHLARCDVRNLEQHQDTLSFDCSESGRELGAAVAWLMLNRPAQVGCQIRLDDGVMLAPVNFYGATWLCDSQNGARTADPAVAVDVFHCHCHFTPEAEDEAAALLQSTQDALRAAGVLPLHHHTWHQKNGPHDPWSWELWTETTEGLGAALQHFARQASRTQMHAGLHLAAHADSGQEYTDHTARLCWVGAPDALDTDFFTPPHTGSYAGPAARRRQTDDTVVWSMGERWVRDSPGGAVRPDRYGEVSRSEHNPSTRQARVSEWPPPLPSLFLPHGSPPIPVEPCASAAWLCGAASSDLLGGRRPSAIVFMSPHYRTDGAFGVSVDPSPETLMDFDPDTRPEAVEQLSQLRYPCPGATETGLQVASMLQSAGLSCEVEHRRGLDHGVWTPLFLLFPEADVPVCCLSVRADLDSDAHIRAGQALAPLRQQGVLLIGSGEVVHNVPEMGARDSPAQPWCTEFEGWVEDCISHPCTSSKVQLSEWQEKAPHAAKAHPPNSPGEHLMPFMFAYGAGGRHACGQCEHKEYLGSLPMAAYSFREGRAPSPRL